MVSHLYYRTCTLAHVSQADETLATAFCAFLFLGDIAIVRIMDKSKCLSITFAHFHRI